MITFPSNPNLGDKVTVGGREFEFNGKGWISVVQTDLVPTKDSTKLMTSGAIYDALGNITFWVGFAAGDEDTPIESGTSKITFRMPFRMIVSEVRASLKTAASGAAFIADINVNGASRLSTKLSINADSKTSVGATTPAVISDGDFADDAEITIDFDQVGVAPTGTGPKFTFKGKLYQA